MGDESNRTDDRYNADINLEDEREVEEWCRSFACTAAKLRAAVKAMTTETQAQSHIMELGS